MDKDMKKKTMEKAEKKAVKKAAKKEVKKKMAKQPSLEHYGVQESSYVKTILDPVNVVGVRIPDEITVPSFTCQVLTKFVLTTNTGTGGNTGAGFSRIIGSTQASPGYQTYPASTTANQYGPGAAVANPWAVQFNSQASSLRLVSAKATMAYLGSPNNASGRFLMCFAPPNSLITSIGAVNIALSGIGAGQNLLQTANLVDVPANKLYAEARYVPLDDQSRSYEVSGSSTLGTLRGASGGLTYGQFIGIIDGAPAAQNIEVNIWENYECIPQTSLVNLVQPQPSLSDPIEMSVASNIISSTPTIPSMQSPIDQMVGTAQAAPSSIGNMSTATKAPSVTKQEDTGSFMSKVLSKGSSMIDTAMDAAPLVEAIAAML